MADRLDRTMHRGAGGLAAFGLTDDESELLLDLAETAIRASLMGHRAPDLDVAELPPALRQRRGTFVTLHVAGELNGCLGNIEGTGSLAVDVPDHAIGAAFEDPRLPALRPDDLTAVSIEISLLSSPSRVPATTRAELLRHLRADEHGLILECGRKRALLLPAVWRQLRQPDRFVDQLLRKARLPVDPWPTGVRAAVFTTSAVHRRLDEGASRAG
ncbi:AmmeMemoRadiSam system protein A [Ilumatobacter sp.]|uniref:AmmeMemoRadiSam system protein A n=1 Tax=Ilumatobacter sp. TaxID=1967498 RepID=UPI003AF8F2C5